MSKSDIKMSSVQNTNKDSFANFRNRKRQHSENLCENIEDYFNKRYDFYCEEHWNIPEPAYLFIEQTWKIDQFQIMKYQLNQVKGQLSQFNLQEWSKHTKARDPAGYVFRQLKKYVKPEILTQAWCKFFECVSQFPVINESVLNDNKFNSFHLCEAPGAFISALNHYLATNYSNLEWEWRVNSLNPEYEGNDLTHMIPDKRLMNFTRERWIFGADNSGDLTKIYNHEIIVSEAEKLGKILLVTADGSVDCMSNPGEQESLVEHLHFCEVVTALTILSPDGSFIIKMFTMFESATICLLYLLYNSFESLHVFKPCTSKSGNSEVYVICLKYKAKENFMNIREKLLTYYKNPDIQFAMFSKRTVPNKFISQIEECNMFFMSKQMKTINDNIFCFNKILPNEYRKNDQIKKSISNSFIQSYYIQSMDRSKYITNNNNFYKHEEICIFDCINENTTENILFNSDSESQIELQSVTGKEISRIMYSEFCDMNYFNLICNEELINPFIFISSLEKFTVNFDYKIEISYSVNNKNTLSFFLEFYKTVRKISCGNNLIIIGSLFLTRFEASLLFLLLSGFTSVQYYSGILLLKEATWKFNTILEFLSQINLELEKISDVCNEQFKLSLLNFLPDKILRKAHFMKFLFDYNNNTLDFVNNCR